jgi:UDP-N-acetylmuramate dehydrogenase
MKFHPIQILENVSLKPKTSFKIGGEAKFFVECKNISDIHQAFLFAKENSLEVLPFGGSSNMLISDQGFDGLVVSIEILGKEILEVSQSGVKIKIFAGENWDKFVAWSCENGWWGLENLSHIPGKVGATVVQNIGAYGAQISDCVESVEVLEVESGVIKKLSGSDCGFGYRKSIFNSSLKGKFVILNLVLNLNKTAKPNLNYGDLQKYFTENKNPTLFQIRQAVIEIRNKKFPFPEKEIGGNAGSFFKNLVLNLPEFTELEKKFIENFSKEQLEKLLQYKNKFGQGENIKISSAFIIDICGFKGREMGRVKVNETQSLVLLNMGGATAKEVLALAKAIRQDVYKKTGLILELEPELVGFSESEIKSFLEIN